MLQHYTIDDQVRNEDELSTTYIGAVGEEEGADLENLGCQSRERMPEFQTTSRVQSYQSRERCTPEQPSGQISISNAPREEMTSVHNPKRNTARQARSRMLYDQRDGQIPIANHPKASDNSINDESNSSEEDASRARSQSGSPVLTLRSTKSNDDVHEETHISTVKKEKLPQKPNGKSQDDLSKTKVCLKPRTEDRKKTPRGQSAVVDKPKVNTSGTRKAETQVAKVDVACPDPKLARYLMSMRKTQVEEIQKRFSVIFIISEKGQVRLEVRRDVATTDIIRNAIGEFQALCDKIREKHPETELFDLRKLKLTEEGLRDICCEAQQANPETTVTLGEDDSNIQVYGISDAVVKAKKWMSENILSVEEDGDEEESFSDGEDEEEEVEEEELEEEEIAEGSGVKEEIPGSLFQPQRFGPLHEEKRMYTVASVNYSKKQPEQMPDQHIVDIQHVTSRSIDSMRSSGHPPVSSPNDRNHSSVSSPNPPNHRSVYFPNPGNHIWSSSPSKHQQQHEEASSSLSPSTSATIETKIHKNNVTHVIDKIENTFDQKILDFIQATRSEEITKISNKHHVVFEMKGDGIVEIRKRNTKDASDIKLKVALCALTSLVKSLKDLESQTINLRDFDDVPQKVLNRCVAEAKHDKHVLIIDGPGCKVEVFGSKDHVRAAVDNFTTKTGLGLSTTMDETRSLPNGSTVRNASRPKFERPNDTGWSGPPQYQLHEKSATSAMSTTNKFSTSSSEDFTTTRSERKPTSRIIHREFDQKILDYIQAVCYDDINKIQIKYGVDFELKGNGLVQIRQKGDIPVSDIKVKVGTQALESLVDSLNDLQSEIIDLRDFGDIHQKIVDNAIAEAKQNRQLLIVDRPGCIVELFGTRDVVTSAAYKIRKNIKAGKIDNKPNVSAKVIGKPKSSTMPASATAGMQWRDSHRLTEVDGSRTPRRRDESYRSFSPGIENFSSNTLEQTRNTNGIWANEASSSNPVGRSSILTDPRNYLECNDDAKQLIQDDLETDGGGEVDEGHWYDGDLQSVVMGSSLAQQSHPNLVSRGMAMSTQDGDLGGAYGAGGSDINGYFSDSDDEEDQTSPEGLINDISAYEICDDDVSLPSPSSSPTVLNTSAGFDIEILQGNITLEFVSVIVSPANSRLGPYTGAARAIREAGGKELGKACDKWIQSHGSVESSRPVYTTGGNLTCSQVLHVVVSPDMGSSAAAAYGENPLTAMMRNVLKICHHPLQATSIAMPAIGIGK